MLVGSIEFLYIRQSIMAFLDEYHGVVWSAPKSSITEAFRGRHSHHIV